ncbi:glycosyltransferase [bacterium]|nr:glycosyltransferase [bacterium]
MMKILFLTEHFPSEDEPDASPVSYFAATNLSKTNKVYVVHANFISSGKAPEIKVEVYNKNFEVIRLPIALPPKGDRLWLRSILLKIALNYALEKLEYLKTVDVIFARMATTPGFAGVRLGKQLKIPALIWAAGSDIHTYPKIPVLRRFNKYALKNAQGITCNSEFLAKETEKLGIPKEKIRVVNTGIDKTIFFPQSKTETRKLLNLPQNKKIVLFAGHLIPIKGIDVLLNAWKIFLEKEPDSQLVLCGNSELLGDYRKLTKGLEISKNVMFRPSIAHSEMRNWFGACDVFVLPSRNEGFPAVLMEAMSCGRPVVASKVGGIPEIVSSDEVGILVEPENIAELVKALQNAFTKNWDAQKISEAASRFDWEIFTKNINKFLNDLISN